MGQSSRADTKKNRRKPGRVFCVNSKTGIEGACSTAVRDLSFDFFLLTSVPTRHPSEEQSRLVASRSCNPRKQSALKQSTEHFV